MPNEKFPIYHFNKTLKEINFRIDTNDTYNVILVPPNTCRKEFPPCSIIIASDVEKFIPLCSVGPGECIRLDKVIKFCFLTLSFLPGYIVILFF
jgi:hypothetical protein